MNTKEWLSRAFHIEKYIRELKMAYQNAYANAVYTSPVFMEKVQTGQNNSSEAKFLKCSSLLEKIDTLLDEQYQVIEEIASAINSMENDNHRAILAARFLNYKTFELIAEESGYSERQVYRLYAEALNKIEICQ